jgi:hypothetical protein
MTTDKRSESQWDDVPEGFGHITPETMDEMERHFAEQDKIAHDTKKKQNPNPPF